MHAKALNKKEGRLLFFWNTTNCALHVLQSQGLKCKPLVTWDKAYLEGKYSASSNNKWDFMQMYKIVQKVSQILSFNCIMKWNIFWGQDQGIWFNFSPFPINNIFFVKYSRAWIEIKNTNSYCLCFLSFSLKNSFEPKPDSSILKPIWIKCKTDLTSY